MKVTAKTKNSHTHNELFSTYCCQIASATITGFFKSKSSYRIWICAPGNGQSQLTQVPLTEYRDYTQGS